MLGCPTVPHSARHKDRNHDAKRDFRVAQEAWHKACCCVNLPGHRSCTGTLLVCHGVPAVLCSGVDIPNQFVASRASAVFFSDGSADKTAAAELRPHVLFVPLRDFEMLIVAVDPFPLREKQLGPPIMPAPTALSQLAATMSRVGTGPELHAVIHIFARPKELLTLHLDDYDANSHECFLQEQAPDESHGAPLFYDRKWVGVLIEKSYQPSSRAQCKKSVLVVHGIGIGRLLAGCSVLGLDNVSTMAIEREPLTTTFLQPRMSSPPFEGNASRDAFRARSGFDVSSNGLCLSTARAHDYGDKGKHYHASVAVKAVLEANPDVLIRLCKRFGSRFLVDARFANGWSLAHVCASNAANNGKMLILLESFGIPLDAASVLGETVAHVAAYAGNVGALRVLRAKGIDFDSTNSAAERPVDKAIRRKHLHVVEWFRRNGVKIPDVGRLT